MSEIAVTDSGISYETEAPIADGVSWGAAEAQEIQRENRGLENAIAFNNSWEQDTPKVTSKWDNFEVDMRDPWEIEQENQILLEAQQAQLFEPVASAKASVDSNLIANVEQMWSADGMQSYLNSSDTGYQSVQLSPQLLHAAMQLYGMSETQAQQFAYYNKLSPQQIGSLEQALTGSSSTNYTVGNQPAPRLYEAQQQVSQENIDYFEPPKAEPNYDQMLQNTRLQYFPDVTPREWHHVVNTAIDVFEQLSPKEQAKYDNPEGIVKLFAHGNQRNLAQTKQQTQRGKVSAKVDATITPAGKIKQSAINALTEAQYAKVGDKIARWYQEGKVDRNA